MIELEPENVKEWLRRMHPTDVCGLAGEFERCPLACYLNEVTGAEIDDAVVGAEYYTVQEQRQRLPLWAANFVDRIDRYRDSNDSPEDEESKSEILASEALDLLDKATRYPNYEDEGVREENDDD